MRPSLHLAVDNTVTKYPPVKTSDVRQIKYEIPLPPKYHHVKQFEFRGYGAMRGFYITCHRATMMNKQPAVAVTISMPITYTGSTDMDYEFIKGFTKHPCIKLFFKE